MVTSAEGFRYPKIDPERCVDCGKCEQTCPYLNLSVKGDILKQPAAWFVRSKDEYVLSASSSGGIFFELAKLVIRKGGVVFGAVWGDKYDEVYHTCAVTMEDLSAMQGSKYLQSDMRLCFSEAKEYLDKGTSVLFSGTPCQIAGLLSFLQRDYENLLTCDLICHGVPSPVVLHDFLAERENRTGKKATAYYRDKKLGWSPSMFRVVYEDGSSEVIPLEENVYVRIFSNHNGQHRLSCYHCRFSRSPRVADISLGDYFVLRDAKDLQGNTVSAADNKGVSLITVNTRQGESWFRQLRPAVEGTQLQLSTVTSWHLFKGPAGSLFLRGMLFYLLGRRLSVTQSYDILYGNAGRLKKYYYRILYLLDRRKTGG